MKGPRPAQEVPEAPRQGPKARPPLVVQRCGVVPLLVKDGYRPWRACGHPRRALPLLPGRPWRALPGFQACQAWSEAPEAQSDRDALRAL